LAYEDADLGHCFCNTGSAYQFHSFSYLQLNLLVDLAAAEGEWAKSLDNGKSFETVEAIAQRILAALSRPMSLADLKAKGYGLTG